MAALERRTFKREPCYLIARRPKQFQDEMEFLGVVKNLSAGGAMIETEFEVEVGLEVDLAFHAGDDATIWEGHGRVVWYQKLETTTLFGMQFTQPLEADWERDRV